MTRFGLRDAFVVAFFAVQYGVLAPWLSAGRGPADGLYGQLVYLAFYAVAAVGLALGVLRRRRLKWPSPPVLWPVAFVALAAASLAWTDEPGLTLRRVAALAGSMTFAVWLVSVWDLRRTLRAVAVALAAVAAASLVLIVVAPQFAIHAAPSPHVGDWRGALLHKNLLGREMAFGAALAAAFGFAARGGARFAWWLAAAAMLALVAGAGSATGWALAVALAGILGFTRLPATNARERFGRRIVGLTGAAAALGALVVAAPALLTAIGRDTTFTGRDRIWELTVERVLASPLGAGYGAFWDGPAGAAISRDLGYVVGHAHNGWLEVAAQLGWLGLVMVSTLVVLVAVRAARSRLPLTDSARTAALLLVGYVVVINVPDAVIAGPNSPTLLLLVVALLSDIGRSGRPRASGVRRVTSERPLVWLLQRTDAAGGVTVIIDALVPWLQERRPWRVAKVVQRDQATASALRDRSRPERFVADVMAAGRWSARLVAERPDVVVTFTPAFGAAAALVARTWGGRTVVTHHGTRDGVGGAARRLEVLARRLGAVHAVVGCSEAVAASYAVGPGPTPIAVVNGVPDVRGRRDRRARSGGRRASAGACPQAVAARRRGRAAWRD